MLTENFTCTEQTISAYKTTATFQVSRTTHFLLFHVLNLASIQEMVLGLCPILNEFIAYDFKRLPIHDISHDYGKLRKKRGKKIHKTVKDKKLFLF